MGIAANAFSITIGAFLGNIFKSKIKNNNFSILAVCIMIIGAVGFIENIFDINEMTLKSNSLLVIIFSLLIGNIVGGLFSGNSKNLEKDREVVFDSIIFFGVGGLQLCGPVLLATNADSSQLFLKSLIDFPFALTFGVMYGKKVALSAIPVAIIQIIIFSLTLIIRDFMTVEVIKQLSSMGYIILFFSGFNMICDKKYQINNTNMLMGMAVVLIYNGILSIWR